MGNISRESRYWGYPEAYTAQRPSFWVNSTGASDLMGSMTAAFAASSLALRKDNPSYSQVLINMSRLQGNDDCPAYSRGRPCMSYKCWSGGVQGKVLSHLHLACAAGTPAAGVWNIFGGSDEPGPVSPLILCRLAASSADMPTHAATGATFGSPE